MASSKKRVSYYYDPDIGNFYYGQVRARSAGTRSPRLGSANRGAGGWAPLSAPSRRGPWLWLTLRARAQGHPMKPHRIRVAHHLIVAYEYVARPPARARWGSAMRRANPQGPHAPYAPV